jgi:signal-transduction protein with cAMP-binding, CBS, and nucleotidyltransferase domain
MAQKKRGSVVIVEDNRPIGIVTERDIVFGVVAKDKKPSDVAVRDIMSSPLKYVSPDMTLKQASRIMAKNNIRRLPVIENGKLVGIITNKDILAISPEMLEILEELSRINASQPESRENLDKGTCEACGDYMVALYEVDGSYVCESCREDMLGGE